MACAMSTAVSTKAPSSSTDLDLGQLLQQHAAAQECGGCPTYFRVAPHMKWGQFLRFLPEDTPGLHGWKMCTQCRNAWGELSTLATLEGEPVFLGGPVESYPEAAQKAVTEYQRRFRLSEVTDQVVRYVHGLERHDGPNLGRRTLGNWPDGRPYTHAFLETGLPKLDGEARAHQDRVNELLRQETTLLESYSQLWAPHVVKRLLDWYTAKGESAAGYRQNTGGLRFMVAFHEDFEKGWNEPRARRVVALHHLLKLFSGEHPADACGAVHVFASGSNMAACRYATSPEAFWRMMDQRYNPTTYRQPTSTPSEGQVKAALKQVDNDLTCFERELLSENDPEAVQRALWRPEPAPEPASKTTMTAEQLLSQVRSKQAPVQAKSTCFDAAPAPAFKSEMTPDEFDQWLAGLPAGTTLEYQVPHSLVPLEMGKPVTQKGCDMVKVPVGWVLPSGMRSRHGLTLGWQRVKQVLPHPGRWRASETDADGETSYPVVSRDRAVVSDGYVVQLTQPHSWRPDCSCLFADFFRGEYHALGKTRQELHQSLRMKQPADGSLPLRGVMLECKLRGSAYQLREKSRFRATLPGGKTQSVTVY